MVRRILHFLSEAEKLAVPLSAAVLAAVFGGLWVRRLAGAGWGWAAAALLAPAVLLASRRHLR